ncbi:hypothetical protein CHARACLAT_033116 [Characodon lateralis]|uniref:Uncharacterized protein n=1 Tax=Characodon lateralis TaxID=208331 RepID=A0ABU7D2P5_9TELE|nr:hypothetical protein [Characodon lateralis]
MSQPAPTPVLLCVYQREWSYLKAAQQRIPTEICRQIHTHTYYGSYTGEITHMYRNAHTETYILCISIQQTHISRKRINLNTQPLQYPELACPLEARFCQCSEM